MVSRSIALPKEAYFHARPAATLAQVAANYQSMLLLFAGARSAEASKMFEVMGLKRPDGGILEVYADGSDEEEALQAMLECLGHMIW